MLYTVQSNEEIDPAVYGPVVPDAREIELIAGDEEVTLLVPLTSWLAKLAVGATVDIREVAK